MLGNVEYTFIAIAPRFTLILVEALERLLSIGQLELFDIYVMCKQITEV